MNHAFSKRFFVGILGPNQNEERVEKGTNYQTIRATASIHAKFLSILQEKTYFFFFFTHPLLQNTHISQGRFEAFRGLK